MIRLTGIAHYLAETEINNLSLCEHFSATPEFMIDKIGVQKRALKKEGQTSSEFCLLAFDQLQKKINMSTVDVDCCVVVTQNPDQRIPHVSAIVHGALGFQEGCASFDISLGCSGYVYALSVVRSFMADNGYKKGLLFTSDQYSNIINQEDKNTVLIFGDGASVSVLEEDKSGFEVLSSDFGSRGAGWKSLHCKDRLEMNGREVFGFTASVIPKSIERALLKTELAKEDISKWYFHQGSKYILDTIMQRSLLPEERVVFDMLNYGNTISSSIPIMLSKDFHNFQNDQLIGISGFGVGLSWGTSILKYVEEKESGCENK